MPKKCLDAALRVAYDHDIWYTCVKLYLQAFFSYFQNFDFSAVKGQKWSKRAKHSVHRVPYLKNHIPYDCHLWYTFVKCWYLQVFSSFWFSWLLGGKSAKNGKKNDKKFCPLHSISQESSIMIVIHGTHV